MQPIHSHSDTLTGAANDDCTGRSSLLNIVFVCCVCVCVWEAGGRGKRLRSDRRFLCYISAITMTTSANKAVNAKEAQEINERKTRQRPECHLAHAEWATRGEFKYDSNRSLLNLICLVDFALLGDIVVVGRS